MNRTRRVSRSPSSALVFRLVASVLAAVVFVTADTGNAFAQSASATLTGTVVDGTGAALSGASIVAVHSATSVRRQVQSDGDGGFVITTLQPGEYVVHATLQGFRPYELRRVVLNVDDRLAVQMKMVVAEFGEAVTVVGEAERASTSPAVSTVIDRQFVENLPLNGRSLQALLELTPGVIMAPVNANYEGGQFSVNGQRSNANYFMVDGVSANAGMSISPGFLGAGGSGQLPALTALGGTNGLVSVDALQEFRVQTSTYAPEFGRVPGGQVSLVTRSGTNIVHGSVFEYFRDDAMDATDWFVNRSGQRKPELRQHNFGGVLGGPILRNRTFAFGSYEGLRLLLPQANVAAVPNMETRRSAAPVVQPYLNALPVPNGQDLGNGFAEFVAVYSDPSEFDSTSVRIDHNASSGLRFFGRISDAPSSSETRAGTYSYVSVREANTRSATAGSTWLVSDRVVQDLRVSYTTAEAPFYARPDAFGGAVVPSAAAVFPSGRDPERASLTFSLTGGGALAWGSSAASRQRMFNLVNSLTMSSQSHEWKIGVDFRRTSPLVSGGLTGSEAVFFEAAGLPQARARRYSMTVRDPARQVVVFDNLSLYAQDHWRLTSRLTLTYGVRWELVPPPRTVAGPEAVTLDNLDNPYGGQVRLARSGSRFWSTKFDNFAPRVGGSYLVSEDPGKPLVVRAGFGVFHDLGYGQVANAFGLAYPFLAVRDVVAPVFPLSPDLLVPPQLGIDPPNQLFVMDPQLEQPYTSQWNMSAEQGIGRRQTLSVSYVGARGYRLLKLDAYRRINLLEWPTAQTTVYVSRNRGYSDYHALQMQFQQRLHRGMQTLISYTLGRSRDTGSSDAAIDIPSERLPPERDYGYSNYDVRHVITAALTYQLPEPTGPPFWRATVQDWGLDVMIRARSGYPVNVAVGVPFPPDTETARVDVVPGERFWLEDAGVPGGRRLNPQAFAAPAAQTQGNLRRGAIRGFNANQVDLALRREFRVVDRVRLQLRFEMFNLFNTPNFFDPSGSGSYLGSAGFGVATRMLGRGLGGLNPLYQMGGPRSSQVAAKILF